MTGMQTTIQLLILFDVLVVLALTARWHEARAAM